MPIKCPFLFFAEYHLYLTLDKYYPFVLDFSCMISVYIVSLLPKVCRRVISFPWDMKMLCSRGVEGISTKVICSWKLFKMYFGLVKECQYRQLDAISNYAGFQLSKRKATLSSPLPWTIKLSQTCINDHNNSCFGILFCNSKKFSMKNWMYM